MLDQGQLRTLIIQPVLKGMSLYSQDAEDLLVGTCAQESLGVSYIKQVGGGPALGPYEMEPNSAKTVINFFLNKKPELISLMLKVCGLATVPPPEQMIHDLFYATAMARLFYLAVPEEIPSGLINQAGYYKKYWNTKSGKATPGQYIINYNAYVAHGKGKANG